MRVSTVSIEGPLLVEPKVFGDDRGYFLETWSRAKYGEHGIAEDFVQDNLSRSGRGTLRGLHLQHPHGQGKLVQVISGEVFDVAVDVRVGSPKFGKWYGVTLSDVNKRQLYVPPGFAHGFCVTSEEALFAYKCTERYHPESEIAIAHDDSSLAIPWPVKNPNLSAKDRGGLRLDEVPPGRLPKYRPRAVEPRLASGLSC